MISRDRIIESMTDALREHSFVLGAALAGSDASGRTDGYSDVDLVIVAEDDRVEDTFVAARRAMAALSPIEFEWRLPEPTWHGHSQIFASLRDADPHHFIDLLVMKASAEDRLLERERHGEMRVLFERRPLFDPVPLDRAAHAGKLGNRLAAIRATFPLFQPLIVRAGARGFPAEATHWYHTLALRPLVDLLRLRHCPDRFDFGLRYLDRDLAGADRREIEELSFPRDPEQLESFRRRIVTRFEAEIEALDRGDWSV